MIELICKANTCNNHGICDETYEEPFYKCLCNGLYQGKHCDKPYRPCDDKPCINGGRCIIDANSFKCKCLSVIYQGQYCQIKLQCKTGTKTPCINGGECIELLESPFFKCICPLLYEGENCHLKKNPCKNNKCPREKICVPQETQYTCDCPPNKVGEKCDRVYDICQIRTCRQNGICKLSYISNCGGTGYNGKNCENKCFNKLTIVVFLDTSQSVSLENWNKMVQVLKQLIQEIIISDNDLNIGIASFSNNITWIIPLAPVGSELVDNLSSKLIYSGTEQGTLTVAFSEIYNTFAGFENTQFAKNVCFLISPKPFTIDLECYRLLNYYFSANNIFYSVGYGKRNEFSHETFIKDTDENKLHIDNILNLPISEFKDEISKYYCRLNDINFTEF